MNTGTVRSVTNDGEQNLTEWENFVRAYCRTHHRKFTDVMEDSMLIELLNVQWLKSRNRQRNKPKLDWKT
jgi:hypothetical protein